MSGVRKKDQTEHRFTTLDIVLDMYDHTLVKKGELTKHDVDKHFKAYKASVRYGCSHNLIYRLNRWYESLWEGRDDEKK